MRDGHIQDLDPQRLRQGSGRFGAVILRGWHAGQHDAGTGHWNLGKEVFAYPNGPLEGTLRNRRCVGLKWDVVVRQITGRQETGDIPFAIGARAI